jgi:hypothetical protein
MARCFSPASSALDRSQKALLNAARSGRGCGAAELGFRGRRDSQASCWPPRSKSKSNWRRMGSTMAPRWRKARRVPVRTTHASQGAGCHAGDGFHGQDRLADRGGGHVFRTQRAQRAQLPEILKAIDFLLGNQSGSFPGLQLTGTDLEDAQNVLTAIAGHSWMLPQVKPNDLGMRTQLSDADAELEFPPRPKPQVRLGRQLWEQLRRNRSHCDYAKRARK